MLHGFYHAHDKKKKLFLNVQLKKMLVTYTVRRRHRCRLAFQEKVIQHEKKYTHTHSCIW